LREHPGFAVRATGTMFGHTLETQFPIGLALAALSISRGALFPPTIRPGSRLKSPSSQPRLWSWEPATGRAKAWPWSKRLRDGAASTGET
jgi:hypothetical protein